MAMLVFILSEVVHEFAAVNMVANQYGYQCELGVHPCAGNAITKPQPEPKAKCQ